MFVLLTKSAVVGNKILRIGSNVIQVASITSRATRGGPLKLKKPFPYEDKKFTFFQSYFDNTMLRVGEENARVIVVDGPVAVGKSAFCEALAEELDMKYFPQPTMDELYIFPSGFDLRSLDDELPESVRTYDHKNFCVDPKNNKSGMFQRDMLYLRFYQYVDALCHLLNSGQGVILERSVYSDYIFMYAMDAAKFVPPFMKNAYRTIRNNVIPELKPPHLVIYLDIPVPVVQERIRTRNLSYEQNSPALTTEYLSFYEKFYKEEYIPYARKFSEVLIYDWTDGGDVDVVVDDIEKIDLSITRNDKKFIWWWMNRYDLQMYRMKVTNDRNLYDTKFLYPWYKHDETDHWAGDSIIQDYIVSEVPDCKYDIGYNRLTEKTNFWKLLFTSGTKKHRHPRHHLVYNKPSFI